MEDTANAICVCGGQIGKHSSVPPSICNNTCTVAAAAKYTNSNAVFNHTCSLHCPLCWTADATPDEVTTRFNKAKDPSSPGKFFKGFRRRRVGDPGNWAGGMIYTMCGATTDCEGYPAMNQSQCGSDVWTQWRRNAKGWPGGYLPPATDQCPQGGSCGWDNYGHFDSFLPSEWGRCGGMQNAEAPGSMFFNVVSPHCCLGHYPLLL